MTLIGKGFVEVDADFAPFWRRVNQEMATGGFDRLGRDSGSRFSEAFSKGSADGAPLAAFTGDLERSRGQFKAVGDQAGKDFSRGITNGLEPAKAKINAFAKDGAASFKHVGDSAKRSSADLKRLYSDISKQNVSRAMRDVERDADRGFASVKRLTSGFRGLFSSLGSGGGGGGFRGLSRDMGSFGAAAGGATATLGGFRIALAALVPITIGFGGALVAAVSALGPLVGLAAAAGTALGAAAQGMGVFTLATMGLTDALKEQIDNQGKAASAAIDNASQQRAAARAIQSAQEGVRTAAQRVQQAIRDERTAVAALGPAYTAARMRLTDFREVVVDASLSLKGARLAAQDARRALAELLAGPSPRVLAEAHRAVTDAVRGESDAVRDLTDAQQALVDLFKPADALDVADATDAVTDAIRNEERARLNLHDQIVATNAILDDPASTDDQKARAALELADAQNAVGDATRDTAHARERLAQLESGPDQAAVESARRRVGDAEYAVAQAAQGTADARADLAEVEQPATSLELAKARLDVAVAENAVGDAQRDRLRSARDLQAAEREGVEGSPEVVAAKQAVADATRDVAEAEHDARRASQALTDAQTSARESLAKLSLAAVDANEKFNKLPPAAQAFARELISLKPKLDELRSTAAQGFFPGATEGLNAAMGSFAEINTVVEKTATVLGEAARKSGELVGSPAFGKDIATIGANNAKVIDTLGEALRHVISAIRHVMVAAGPLTQWLADTINKWALHAAAAAKSGRETGKLADFFEKTRAIAVRLGSIIGHLASGLLGLGKAGSESGNDIWESIDKAAARFDKWANSTKGQEALKDFFRESKELAAALAKIIFGVSGALAFLTLKVLPLTDALQILAPLADDLTIAFVAFKVATKAWAVTAGVAAFATGGWTTAFWALNAALYANPIGLIIGALVAIGAALYLAWTKSETFRDVVTAAFEGVKKAFGWLWQAAKDVFGWLKEHWPLVLGILTGPIGLAILAIKEFGPKLLDAAKWLLDKFVEGVKAAVDLVTDVGGWILEKVIDGFKAAVHFFDTIGDWINHQVYEAVKFVVEGFKSIGGWILARVIDGFKVVTGLLGTVGGWLKNRFEEFVHNSIEGWKVIGGWVLNRIVDGFKTVTDLLGSVGGWIRNRIGEFIHNEIEGLKVIGSWILNRVVDGIKTVTDALGSIGGWLKNRLMDIIDSVGGGLKSVGGSIVDYIVDGMKSGINKLISFVNVILDIIEEIPGVKDIDPIKHLKMAQGGVNGLARGGAFARTGGLVTSPIVLMGEEAPTHPEFVIPTNPAYRDRAQQLLMQAMETIGLAEGGVVSAFRSAIKRTGASTKPSLALWEAGLVESGLRNLTYGHADSRGALQVRDSTARGMGLNNMDPLAVALAFLNRGYWGKGSAIQLAAGNPGQSAGWVAQQTQGSAFPDAYDQVRDSAMKYLSGDEGGGGLLSKITGVVGDLLSKGASFILDKLPGTGAIPDWLKGTGGWILEQVGGWIKDKVGGLFGGNGDGGEGVLTGTQAKAAELAQRFNATITSGYRSPARNAAVGGAANSSHTHGSPSNPGAHDFIPAQGALLAAALGMGAKWVDSHDSGSGLHSHVSWFAQGGLLGAGIPPYGGTFATGGIVPGAIGSPRLIEAHGGEAVMPNGMQLHADIYIGGQKIDERVDVRLSMRDRQSALAWNAGMVR